MPAVDLPLQTVRSLAASVLQAEAPTDESLASLAGMCRRVGALDEARALLARLSEGSAGLALLDALRGRPQPAGGGIAAPFHRQTGFLPAEDAAEVLRLANAALPGLVSSEVENKTDERRLDPSTRRSRLTLDVEAMRSVFMPHVKALMKREGLFRRFGLPRDEPGRYELQFTVHGDGCFFKPHADARPGSNQGRAITFVYYFFNPPQGFTGGDLLLFDAPDADQSCDLGAFTRVTPEGNSVVVFPSVRMHEVTPVRSGSDDLMAGRFTLNGWFHH